MRRELHIGTWVYLFVYRNGFSVTLGHVHFGRGDNGWYVCTTAQAEREYYGACDREIAAEFALSESDMTNVRLPEAPEGWEPTSSHVNEWGEPYMDSRDLRVVCLKRPVTLSEWDDHLSGELAIGNAVLGPEDYWSRVYELCEAREWVPRQDTICGAASKAGFALNDAGWKLDQMFNGGERA